MECFKYIYFNLLFFFLLRIIENSLSFRGSGDDDDSGEKKKKKRWLTYHFFDIETIASKYRPEIASLKPHFTSLSEEAKKYTDDLFMVAPFYHR